MSADDAVRAVVTYVNDMDGSEQIEVNGHNFQFGGMGDGYCYAHQSFDCLDNITEAERSAIQRAEQFDQRMRRTPMFAEYIGLVAIVALALWLYVQAGR